jgi:hypothetical protein
MNEFNWLADVWAPVLVAAITAVITTVIGFSAWLTKWIERRIDFRYERLLETQKQDHAKLLETLKRDHAEQLEVLRMLPRGLEDIDNLVIEPALIVRNRLRSVHQGEGEPGAVADEVGAATGKLRKSLETSRHSLLMFGILEQAHAIKNSVVGINGDLKDGVIKLEKEDHELGKAVDELTQLINAMQDSVQLWIPSPPERVSQISER